MKISELTKAYETLRVTFDRGALHVTLDVPETRNALSARMLAELADVFGCVQDAEPEVRAVAVTGAGTSFCSGMDLRERTGSRIAPGQPLVRLVHSMRRLPVPVIGRVNGATRAGGIVLLIACDIVIADPSATFSMTETRLGLTPEMTLAAVTGQVSARLLRRFALTGEIFDGCHAERMGLVSQVSDPGELDTAVDAVLDGLRLCSPAALAATKTRLGEGAHFADEGRLLAAAEASNAAFTAAEAQEGIAAARSGRAPRWAL